MRNFMNCHSHWKRVHLDYVGFDVIITYIRWFEWLSIRVQYLSMSLHMSLEHDQS